MAKLKKCFESNLEALNLTSALPSMFFDMSNGFRDVSCSQESVHNHSSVIFKERARGTQCGAPPRTRKAWVLRPGDKVQTN